MTQIFLPQYFPQYMHSLYGRQGLNNSQVKRLCVYVCVETILVLILDHIWSRSAQCQSIFVDQYQSNSNGN